jgi:tetratricopeptide (TPR) repeat protein
MRSSSFPELTEDYPELPEPYNNLAVLYAAQADYERAKNSLEMAIRTHPSYATAHENLGDIYAKMASQAYDKALQLDKSNTSAQTKLALIRDLFSPTPRAQEPSKQSRPHQSQHGARRPRSPNRTHRNRPAATSPDRCRHAGRARRRSIRKR